MKVKDRIEFLSLLKRCLPGISGDSNFLMEGADSFLFDGKRIYSYNDFIFVSVPFVFNEIKKDEVISIKAKKFYDFLNVMDSDSFELNKEKKSLLLKDKKSKATFHYTEQSVFSSILSLMAGNKDWKKLPKDFFQGLSACIIPNNLTEMKGVFVSGNKIFSTDRKRICKWELDGEMDDFMIPDDSAKELIKMENVKEYSLDDNWIHFRTDFDTYFSVRKMDTSIFPMNAINSVIEDNKKEKEDLENEWEKNFLDVLKRSMIFTTDSFDPVLFKLRKDFMIIQSSTTFGNFSEKIKFKNSFEKDISLDLWFYPTMLLNSFRSSNIKFYLKPKGERTIIVFFNDKYNLIMSSIEVRED